jgi:hypothetical protein
MFEIELVRDWSIQQSALRIDSRTCIFGDGQPSSVISTIYRAGMSDMFQHGQCGYIQPILHCTILHYRPRVSRERECASTHVRSTDLPLSFLSLPSPGRLSLLRTFKVHLRQFP